MNPGIFLALLGALILTPDTLLMRLSELSGGQMVAWRATQAGSIFFIIGLCPFILSRSGVKPKIWRKSFVALVFVQMANVFCFAYGIYLAPVAIVLIAVATVPVFSIILGAVVLKEAVDMRTWAIVVIVFLGVTLSVIGDINSYDIFNLSSILGGLCGLVVAFSLACNFVIIRKDKEVAFPLALGTGGILCGLLAFYFWPSASEINLKGMFYISITGLLILPLSFILLSRASRMTPASNVSIIMLLETILGPLWVWTFTTESPQFLTIIGGIIVILALIYFFSNKRTQEAT
ncbi:MAG: DMT family transporter [Paracoccaceae bacterium]|nr:DMT family transporter [Paracoccaceae bacterium]